MYLLHFHSFFQKDRNKANRAGGRGPGMGRAAGRGVPMGAGAAPAGGCSGCDNLLVCLLSSRSLPLQD